MDWMKQLGGVLDRYADRGAVRPPDDAVHEDFDQFVRAAPPDAVADGLSAAFRPNTRPLSLMASQLFGRAGGPQRANILSMLLTTVGPLVVQQLLARRKRGTAASGQGRRARTDPPRRARCTAGDAADRGPARSPGRRGHRAGGGEEGSNGDRPDQRGFRPAAVPREDAGRGGPQPSRSAAWRRSGARSSFNRLKRTARLPHPAGRHGLLGGDGPG